MKTFYLRHDKPCSILLSRYARIINHPSPPEHSAVKSLRILEKGDPRRRVILETYNGKEYVVHDTQNRYVYGYHSDAA